MIDLTSRVSRRGIQCYIETLRQRASLRFQPAREIGRCTLWLSALFVTLLRTWPLHQS